MLTQQPVEQKLAQALPISNAPVVGNGMGVAADSINLGYNKEKEFTNQTTHNNSKQPVIYQYNNFNSKLVVGSNTENHSRWPCTIL